MLDWLEQTSFSAFVRSDFWGWPVALTVHALGTALVVGLNAIVALRLLGVLTLLPYASLRRLFPAIWAAIALQVASGFMLWMTHPVEYMDDGAFLLKTLLFAAGIAATLVLTRTLAREAAIWDGAGAVSASGARAGAACLLLWCGVLVTGRLIAQLGSLG